MSTIVIVRHGNTFDPGDTVLRVGGRTDLPLSSSGLMQASKLAEHFTVAFPDGFSAAICSPLRRTRETLERILADFDAAPNIETDPFLTEIDYGPDEGQPEDKVIARVGANALALWDETAKPPPGWHVDPDQLRQDWRTFFKGVSEAAPEAPVLVVTSNGIARFALDVLTAPPPPNTPLKLKTGAYGVVQFNGDDIALQAWNKRPDDG